MIPKPNTPPEKLSVMERLHQDIGARLEQGNTIRLKHQYRTGPDPEALAEAQRRQKAKAIPDSDFDGDPEVQQLRAISESRAKVADGFLEVRLWLDAQRDAQTEALRTAEDSLLWAMLDDAANGQDDFPRTSKALADIQRAKGPLSAIAQAFELVASGDPIQLQRLYHAATGAEEALQARLWELKLAQVAGD